MKAGVFGIGAALPEEVVTNADLMKHLDTNDEWIVRRTGIRERRHLNGSRTLADLAAEACTMALKDAGRDAADVDRVMVCSLTPDRMMPGLAPAVALQIGCDLAGAVDLNAACAGFLYALDHAAGLVESGRAKLVVVCGAEALSRITDHTDRGTAILFADGAGAVVVAGGDLDRGLSTFELRSDGRHSDLLYVDIDERLLRMEGREVYRHAVARMVEATTVALANARASASTTSTSSSPTRPTPASSRPPRGASACPRRRSSSTSTPSPTPRARRSRSRSWQAEQEGS